jgi:hypothetical protein
VSWAGGLMAQEVPGGLDLRVLGPTGALLFMFAYLMFRGMGRADKRADDAAATVLAAAASERDRARDDEREADTRWEAERAARMADQREFLADLQARNETIAQLRAEVEMLRRTLPPTV